MTTTLHVTIDKKIKEKAQKLAKDMGLDLSSVVKATITSFVETQTLHIEKPYRMTPHLESIIAEARKDYKTGKNISGPFSTDQEVERHLRKLMKK